MWTKEARRRHDRSHLRYESDLTDQEWAEVAPMIPPAKPGGDKRTVNVREILNGIVYILSSGCQWRAIPNDLPPPPTIHDYLERWAGEGTLEQIHNAWYVKCREQASRETTPTAAIIDSQSVKSAEKRGPRSIRRGEPVLGRAFGPTRGTPARRSRARSGISWLIQRV